MGMDPIVFLLITLLLYGNGSYSVSITNFSIWEITLLLYGNGSYSVSINNFTLIWEWIL